MLQPRTYPQLIGKALVLEADPFVVMVDDDNPWIEGLFIIVSVGVLIGFARLIGGLLMTASLPPANAILEAILQAWRQASAAIAAMGADPLRLEDSFRRMWDMVALFTGYSGSWSRLFLLVWAPFGLLVRWLFVGLVSHAVALFLGGKGTLNQTLGATALIVAPRSLLLLSAIPFVSVSGLLLSVWGLLITYRAVEVTHELPWQRALLAALAPSALLLILVLVGAGLMGIAVVIGGGV